ncbi:MAG: hypothetical protein Q9Q40_12500 [Acidobacteriota bacterium]|nr:hypothetical protein [Acidobacteriota bacterium]MDQ7087272.1 hypothetical protein [Acidobacteriota bacterium]
MKKGGGIAILVLLIALAVVLYLSARDAAEVLPVLEENEQAAREVAGPGELPGLGAMQAATGRHAAEVDALLSGEDDSAP